MSSFPRTISELCPLLREYSREMCQKGEASHDNSQKLTPEDLQSLLETYREVERLLEQLKPLGEAAGLMREVLMHSELRDKLD